MSRYTTSSWGPGAAEGSATSLSRQRDKLTPRLSHTSLASARLTQVAQFACRLQVSQYPSGSESRKDEHQPTTDRCLLHEGARNGIRTSTGTVKSHTLVSSRKGSRHLTSYQPCLMGMGDSIITPNHQPPSWKTIYTREGTERTHVFPDPCMYQSQSNQKVAEARDIHKKGETWS